MRQKPVKLAIISEADLWHHCYSYSMVRAIWENLTLVNDDLSFANWVRQNYIGQGFLPWIGVGPVNSQLASGQDLRRKRNDIFKRYFGPWIGSSGRYSPTVL